MNFRLKTPESRWFYHRSEYNEQKKLGKTNPEKSFCETFYAAFDEAKEKYQKGFRSGEAYMDTYCSHANDTMHRVYAEVNDKAVKFLFENDGVIDRWPDPDFLYGFHYDKEGASFSYNYFGADYVAESETKVIRKSYEPQERSYNTPEYPYYTEVTEKIKKQEAILDKMSDYCGFFGAIRKAIVMIPVVIASLFTVTNLLCLVFGKTGAEFAEKIIAGNPEFWEKWDHVLMSVLELLGLNYQLNQGTVWFWVILGIFWLVAGIAAFILQKMFFDEKFNKAEYKAAKKELRLLKKEQKEAFDKDREIKKVWALISFLWNHAYYEFAKEKGVDIE